MENELPPKCVQDAHVLTVPDVDHEDSGTYVCTASNKQGKVQAFTKLNVHGESRIQISNVCTATEEAIFHGMSTYRMSRLVQMTS